MQKFTGADAGAFQNIIVCHTLVDVTPTGTIGHFKKDQTQQDFAGWTYSRNQQRNLETLIQIISLRAQPSNLETPRQQRLDLSQCNFGPAYTGVHTVWSFRFSVEYTGVYDLNGQSLMALVQDLDHVPCIFGLSETVQSPQAMFLSQGPNLNTYFKFLDN